MTTNNDLLIDANTVHQVQVVRVGEQAARKSLKTLSQARDAIKKELLKVDSLKTKKQLRELNKALEKKLIKILQQYPELLTKDFRKFISAEYEFQKKTITAAIEQAQAVKVPTQKDALTYLANTPMAIGTKGAAVSLTDMLKDFAPTEAKRVTARVTSGFYSGETTQQIAQAIVGTARNKYKDGLLNVTKSNAFTMAKTGVTHLQQAAKTEFNNSNDDIVWGYEIVATLDSRTSDTCRARDGQQIKGQIGPKPPFHYNCRSTTVPVLKKEFQVDTGATRGSVKGPVGAETTYYSWLKKQNKSFIDEALGPEKGKLFRNAGLSPEEFRKASVNRFYQPLTIAQMAAKNNKIAEYISKGK